MTRTRPPTSRHSHTKWSTRAPPRPADGLIMPCPATVTPGRSRDIRWIYLHMIAEYARHNGHADLIREQIDGNTGD